MKIALPILLVLPLVAAGCAGSIEGEFPSLAKRPFEDKVPIADDTGGPPAPPESLTSELARKLASLQARVRKADSEFRALLPATRTRAAAARGMAESSPGWVDAHIQLSRLDRTRADAVAALSELDKLVITQLEAELTGKSPRYSELMKVAQGQIGAIVAQQNREIEAIDRMIGA